MSKEVYVTTFKSKRQLELRNHYYVIVKQYCQENNRNQHQNNR